MAPKPRTVAIANEKGGVGKTTTTLGLASTFMAQKRPVLLIDMDPQANCSSGLGVEATPNQPTTYSLMAQNSPGAAADAVVATAWEGVDLIPSSTDLARMEADGSNDLIFRLDMAFEGLDLSGYDAVLIDCPPSLGKLLYSSLCLASDVVILTEPEKWAVRGVGTLLTTMRSVRRRANPNVTLKKIVINKRRHNVLEHEFRETELRDAFGPLVAKSVVPDLAARKNATSSNTPVHEYTGSKSAAIRVAYDGLVEEIFDTPHSAVELEYLADLLDTQPAVR